MSCPSVCRLALILVNLLALGQAVDVKAFDDNILFRINWPGPDASDLLETPPNTELYTITSANKEQYQCLIPNVSEQEISVEEKSTEKNPIELLAPLFEPNACSFRLESYWTYEVCHGRYVLQYHEERENKKEKQNYELGKLEPAQLLNLVDKYYKLEKKPNGKPDIPYKKIDGVKMPYVEIEMTDGTICDINEQPRSIKVLYVCHHYDKHEVYSLKEVSSCEYEAIVKTPLLCEHPDYRPQDTKENKITCRPVGKAPKKPRSLMALEAERIKMRYQKASSDSIPQKVIAIFRINKDGQDGHSQVSVEYHPEGSFTMENTLSNFVNHGNTVLKADTIQAVLNGESCLIGGSGWWKFEFCYGRSVAQYHVNTDGSKLYINLGVFDEEEHKNWIDANPKKKPKLVEQRRHVSHLYTHGSVCEETGKARQTEVKLKCVKNEIGRPISVSMYLEEHRTCEYELAVESPIFCDIFKFIDEYGLKKGSDDSANSDKYISSLRPDNEERIARDEDEL